MQRHLSEKQFDPISVQSVEDEQVLCMHFEKEKSGFIVTDLQGTKHIRL